MPYELFVKKKEQHRGLSVRISGHTFLLSRPAADQLKGPRLLFHWDAENCRIALEAADSDTPNAYCLRSPNDPEKRSVHASAFLKWIGYRSPRLGGSRVFPASWNAERQLLEFSVFGVMGQAAPTLKETP